MVSMLFPWNDDKTNTPLLSLRRNYISIAKKYYDHPALRLRKILEIDLCFILLYIYLKIQTVT